MMNKTTDTSHTNVKSDFVPSSNSSIQRDTGHQKGIVLLEVSQETSPRVKPFEIDRYSDQENTAWLSMIYDLMRGPDELAELLRNELRRKSWLNAYLLAAGINQIVEDYLHPDPFLLGKATKYLDRIPYPIGPFLGKMTRVSIQVWAAFNQYRKETRKLVAWQRKLASLVDELAEVTTGIISPDGAASERWLSDGETLMASIQQLPAPFRDEVIRLPSCFRSFDQQPEDLRRIVEEFSIQWPDRFRPICVVGVRTSGSYLAPLFAAILKSHGYQKVNVLTLRPGHRITDDEWAILHRLAHGNGLALLCDDPPLSGATLTKAAWFLEHAGLSHGSIILLLQLFSGSKDLPASLQGYSSVLMPWPEWSIHQRLDLEAVRQVLSEAYAPHFDISNLIRLPSNNGGEGRQHVHALFSVELLDNTNNQGTSRLVQVLGAGLGYFGEHALAVAQRLPGFSTQIVALRDGLLYQEISPHTHQVSASMLGKEKRRVENLLDYIQERNHQLPVRDDISLRLNGRNAVWEVASNMLSKVFGRGWYLARVPLIDPYVKRLLRSAHPSVIDGDMALHLWYLRENSRSSMVKLDQAERDFSHHDLLSYDPIYDLASLAIEIDPLVQPDELLSSYESLVGEKIAPERWMLYQLVHLWDLNRQSLDRPEHIDRRMAKVLQGYYSKIYFQDQEIMPRGPLCTLDIDGVLETNQLEFPSLTASSAKSLRALAFHDYRVILTTGRSLDEVQERCTAYHLAGGVAEYGAVLYSHITGQVIPLLTESEQITLNELRSRLSKIQGIYLDSDYRFVVYAYCLDENGRRKGLSREHIASALDEPYLASQVRAIPGETHTDFMMNRIDKGFGLKEWIARLESQSINPGQTIEEGKPIMLAVGDSAEDLPVFSLAKMAYAPANASLAVKQAGTQLTSRPYQRGLEQAVTKLLGHKPGGCPVCQQGALPPETIFMQEILATQENGRSSMMWQAIKIPMRKVTQRHVGTQ